MSQHRLLDDAFRRVGSALSRSAMTETRATYLQLRAALEAHISLEDHDFFPTLAGLRPSRLAELEQLSLDHQQFREELARLFDLLAEGSKETFDERFARFERRFHAHEACEEGLFRRTVRDPQRD